MANASSFKLNPTSALAEGVEFNFHGLYMYQTSQGLRPNEFPVVDRSLGVGTVIVNNWTVREEPRQDAKVVARGQGLHLNAGNWYCSFSLVFEEERLKGSTLQVAGIDTEDGQWAIVGGTGRFAMATGVIHKRMHAGIPGEGRIIELTIQGFCPVLNASKVLPTKLGTWGGKRGTRRDPKEPPTRLESITICSGSAIDSIAFSYVGQDGQKHTAGPWGGKGGNPTTIQLDASEFVNEVSGTYSEVEGFTIVTSLKLVTNVKAYGPFGDDNGPPFTVPVQEGSTIAGFFVNSGKYIDAIGVYVHPLLIGSRILPTKLGTWGGKIGTRQNPKEPPKRLESITIHSGSAIDSIAYSYVGQDGQKHKAGPWGGQGDNPTTIQLDSSEFVNEVSGTFDELQGVTVIMSLTLVTNVKAYGPFGEERGTPFVVPVQEGSTITGFFVNSGKYIDAIGVYVQPL